MKQDDLIPLNKEQVAKAKFESGAGAFTYGLFSDAVSVYRQSGRIYSELGMKKDAFMAFYQALITRSKEYPGFFNKKDPNFLRPEYCQELEDFVTDFSEFEKDEYYKEKYLRGKYRHLLAKPYKFNHENDFEAEQMALLELASFVEAHPDIFRGEHYQVENVFKWRMMAEQCQARMLRLRGENVQVVAEGYKRIADICEPPSGSTPSFLKEVRAYQSNFYADSFKFMAFSNFDKRRPSISDLKEALENMKQALDHAQKAKGWFDQIDKEKGLSCADNLRYLSYWYNIFLLRVSVVDKEFDKAKEVLKSALSDAGYFINLKKGGNIFPNIYSDFADLQNENLIISAGKAIVLDRDTVMCSDLLKQWLDLSKEKHFGSWRFNNVYIRYLVASILTMMPSLGEHLQDCKQKMEKMDEILKHEFVGSASRNLVTIVKDMTKYVGGDIYETLFQKVCDFFPIDSTSRDFKTIESPREVIDPLEYLPEYFSKCFKKPENLKEFSPYRIKELYQALVDGFRYYLIIITEFHYKRYVGFKQQGVSWLQVLPDNFRTNFAEMTFDELKFSLGEICKALGDIRFQRFQLYFSDVEGLCDSISQTVTPDMETVEEILQVIVTKVIPKTFMSFFPHIIQVTGNYELQGEKLYKAMRIWEKSDPRELRLSEPGLILEEGAYYYLTPGWKRYGRKSVITRSGQLNIFKSDLYSFTVGKGLIKYKSNLKPKLLDCPPGKDSWRDYEDICTEILNYLFVPPLSPSEPQVRTEDGQLRRDAIFYNPVERGFWNRVWQKYGAEVILFEFKNTDKLKPSDVTQVEIYLRRGQDTIGRFGIILSRKPPSKPALDTRESCFGTAGEKFLILFLDDGLLLQMLELKEAGKDPVKILQAQYEEFLKRYNPRSLIVP